MSSTEEHWLDRYSTGYHAWKEHADGEHRVFERPIGFVERSFDIDGVHYGGRADLYTWLQLKARCPGGSERLHQQVLLAWTVFRLQHALALATIHDDPKAGRHKRWFRVALPCTADAALARGRRDLVFLQESLDDEGIQKFCRHTQNCGRVVEASTTQTNLFVVRLERVSNDDYKLDLVLSISHMVADGMTFHSWIASIGRLLNKSEGHLRAMIQQLTTAEHISNLRLPPPQDDVYLQVPGNKARQRWFWLIMRILRHVRKPRVAGFINPIRHKVRPKSVLPYDPTFSNVLEYDQKAVPPLESATVTLTLSKTLTQRVIEACRATKVSLGAGGFTLAGMAMSKLYELEYPDMALNVRRPFVASFPLNPRPFLNYKGPPDSCMLAFSEGIVIPYIPTDLDAEARFRVLVRATQRELKIYQKRPREATDPSDPHTPLRVQASTYLATLERADNNLPEELRKGVDIQGDYPPAPALGVATCGVSSVGSIKELFHPGMYSLDKAIGDEIAVDWVYVDIGLRTRENEFLIGFRTGIDGRLEFVVHYDATAMDAAKVQQFFHLIESTFTRQTSGAKL